MKSKYTEVPIELLHEYFDLVDGVLIRKIGRCRALKDSIAGCPNGYGYLTVTVLSKHLLVHRAIFAMANGYWPQNDIDHIDHNKTNNRPENLREATRLQNAQNGTRRTPASGYRGVSWYPRYQKWMVQVSSGSERYTGYFTDIEEANEAAIAARERLHGEFASHYNRNQQKSASPEESANV